MIWFKSRHLFALSAVFVANLSFAGAGGVGSGVGNAGTVVSLPDGSVVLADPYDVDNNGPYQKFSNLNPVIQTELGFLDRLLVRYGAIPDQSPIPDTHFASGTPQTVEDAATAQKNQEEAYSRNAQSDFLMNHVLFDQVQYYFVDTLPQGTCVESEYNIELPDNISGAITEMAACTVTNETFIRQDLYAKMDVRNQTMLLLHERLHSLLPTDHQNIINITNGAFLALDLYRQQSLVLQAKPNAQLSDFTPLTAPQIATLQQMVISIASMNYLRDGTAPNEDGGYWSIEPNGGGIYFFNPDLDPGALVNDNATVSKIAFLGAGSVLGKQGTAGDNVVMINSSCFTSACILGNGSSMIESSASAVDENAQKFRVVLDPTAQISGSQITVNSPDSSALVHLAPAAQITSSSIQGIEGLEAEAGASIEQSILTFNPQDTGLTQLDLGAGSDTQGVKAIISTRSTPASGFLHVSVPANQKLQLQMTDVFQCQPGFISSLSSDLSITSLASITGLCSPYLRPGANN